MEDSVEVEEDDAVDNILDDMAHASSVEYVLVAYVL